MTGPTGILIYHPTGSKPMSPGQLGIQFGLNLVQALLAALLLEFMPFRLEDIAVGGKLISEGGDPDYYLEVSHPNLNEEQKQTFVREVTPLLVRLLNLGPQSWLARLLRITDPLYSESAFFLMNMTILTSPLAGGSLRS